MSDFVSHPMADLPFPLDHGTDVMQTKDPPTCPCDSQGEVRRSVSLSPYGVEDMTEEERKRYERSASLSPTELNKFRIYQLFSKESSIPPEIPPFRLPSERQISQNDQIEGPSMVSHKRKRSPTLASDKPTSDIPMSDMLVSSTPPNPKPQGSCSFRGVIEHRRAEEALDFAWKMETCAMRTDNAHRHIFWTDASIVFGACAAGAVVWKQPPSWEWKVQGFPYPHLIQSTEVVEMFAIAHALKHAVDDIKQSLGDAVKDLDTQITHEVFVFTDSIGALISVERDAQRDHARRTSQQAHTIIEYSIDLNNLGAKVELHLVPGHTGVPGNDRAHKAAYEAAKHAAAAAGISSTEQGWAMHKNQASVVMFPGTVPQLVPATPVPAGRSRGSRKRASLLSASPDQAGNVKRARKLSSVLSQPLLWRNLKAKTPPTMVPPLDPTDEELVNMKGKRSKCIPRSHSVRPDRTPEPAPVLEPSFTSVNVGSRSSTGFTPINRSSTLLTGSAAKGSSARIKWSALNPRHWFMPVDKRSAPWGASVSSGSPIAQSFGLEQLVSGLRNEPASIGDAASFFGAGQLLSPSGNKVPAAVLESSAVSKTFSEPLNPERIPGSKQSSVNFLHRFRLQNSGNAAFGETVSSSFIPQGNQPAAEKSALTAVSSCLDFQLPTTNVALVPAFTHASFTVPKSFCFSPRSQSNHSPNPNGNAAPPPRRSILATIKSSTSFVTTSKMRSFASPGEPKEAITLAPFSSFYDDNPKQCADTALPQLSPSSDAPKPPSVKFTISQMELFASPGGPEDGIALAPLSSSYDDKPKQSEDTTLTLVPPSISDAPKPPSLKVAISKMRSFAFPGEPKDGITLAPFSSSNDDKLKQCEKDTALPPLPPQMLEVPKTPFLFATTSNMRSFAFPGVPLNGPVLAPVSSPNEGTLRPTMSSGPKWPPFTQSQTMSPDAAKFRSGESPRDDSNSASMPASEPSSSL